MDGSPSSTTAARIYSEPISLSTAAAEDGVTDAHRPVDLLAFAAAIRTPIG